MSKCGEKGCGCATRTPEFQIAMLKEKVDMQQRLINLLLMEGDKMAKAKKAAKKKSKK